MWRAIIVDDEPITRYGIKASVDWRGEDIEMTADCANGAEALRIMEQSPVDILITDIKMPVMDGLAITRRALKLNPGLKVVLVSSHNDFEFVREGLKLGVIDYILKHTLEPEELLQIIRKCKELLEKDVRDQGKVKTESRRGAMLLRKAFEGELKRFLIQHADAGTLTGECPDWLDGDFAALCMKLNRVFAIEEQHGFMHKSLMLEQFFDAFHEEEPDGIAIQSSENELFFLLPLRQEGREAMRESRLEASLPRLKHLLEQAGQALVTIGYCQDAGIEGIRRAFERARVASDRGFFEGNGIYCCNEGSSAGVREGKRLPNMLQTAPLTDGDQLKDAVEEWKEDWVQGGCSPLALKEQASRVLSAMFKRQADPYALVECFDRLFKTESLEDLCDILMQSVKELRESDLCVVQGIESQPVDKALDYIHAHYAESMTLQQVADYAHVSKNYFSILFKKIVGQNFIDYVITLRVQKAKEMLSCTELRVYEVADQSGFNDVKYFGKLFKKISGFSPIEYREQYGSYRKPPESHCSGRGGDT